MKVNVSKIFRFLLTLVAILVVVEIVFTNQLASHGGKLRTMNTTIDLLRQENLFLATQVASASALLTIRAKAGELGLIVPAKLQFVTLATEQPVALNLPQ